LFPGKGAAFFAAVENDEPGAPKNDYDYLVLLRLPGLRSARADRFAALRVFFYQFFPGGIVI